MLTSQVQYWNLQETKRHNWEAERAAYQQAEAARRQADAALLNAETNKRNADTNLYTAQVNERLGWANYSVANRLADSNIDLNLSQKSKNIAETGLTNEKTNTQVYTTKQTKELAEQEQVKTMFQPREIFAQLNLTEANTAESKARKNQGWVNSISNAVRAVGSLFSPLGGN